MIVDVYPLFASNVFVGEIEESLDVLQKIKKYEFIDTNSYGSSKSLISKNRKILNDFPRVKQIVERSFNSVKNNFLEYSDTKFSVTTSWATKITKESVCQFHSHTNCLYSGILYFDDYGPDSANIEFESPYVNQQLLVKPKSYNIFNAHVYAFKPRKNLIILFQSNLRHRITQHFSENERYSLAFNFMPIGKIGDGDSFIDLSLNS